MPATNVYGTNYLLATAGQANIAASLWGGGLRVTFDTYDASGGLDSGSTIALARIPSGSVVFGGRIWAPTDSDATLAVGVSGAAEKYMAATAAAAGALAGGVWFGVSAGIGSVLSSDEIVIVTVGAATYNGGVIKLLMMYATP